MIVKNKAVYALAVFLSLLFAAIAYESVEIFASYRYLRFGMIFIGIALLAFAVLTLVYAQRKGGSA